MESKKLADEVIIYGKHAGKLAVFHESEIQLNRTMKFIGKYGPPVVIAKNGSLLNAISNSTQTIKVAFINITFQGKPYSNSQDVSKILIYLHDSSLDILKCSFIFVARPLRLTCNRVCALKMKNTLIGSPIVGIFVEGDGHISMNFMGTNFVGKPGKSENALIYGWLTGNTFAKCVQIKVSHCTFSYFKTAVWLYPSAKVSKIVIVHSSFYGNEVRQFCSGVTSSSVSVSDEYQNFRKTKLGSTQILLMVYSSVFQNNSATEGSGISLRLEKSIFHGVIKNCTFKNNLVWLTGGAISIFKDGKLPSKLYIVNSQFVNNTALKYRGSGPFGYFGGRLKGTGGAISLAGTSKSYVFETQHTIVKSCTFTANSAETLGGSIYAVLARLKIKNSRISTPRKIPLSNADGTIISVTGSCSLYGVEIDVNDPLPQRSVVRIEEFALIDKETRISCPIGTIIKSIEVGGGGIYDFISFFCSTCSISKYNLYGGTFSRFRVNESFCKDCPPGASCKNGRLRPVDNYWGFLATVNSNLSFIELPPGYGCTNKQCKRYDSCAKNRQGTLCSTCMKGYSESMFSPECIRNEDCDKRSFYAVAATLVIFYLLFFIYKKRILRFLKTQLLWFKSLERGRNGGNAYSLDEDRYRLFSEDITSETEGGTSDDNLNRPNPQSDSLPGLIKIVFYFYQIEALLDVYGGKMEHNIVKGAKGLIQNILNFNFLNSSGSSSCAIDDTTPMIKVIIRGAFVASIIVAFILLYIICRILQRKAIRCCKKRSIFTNTKSTFGDRVLAALFEVVLLSYGIITKAITSMLNCKTVGNKQVLYLQGDVQCYQTWQYGLAAAGLAWVVPFCLYVNLLPNLIREKQVETKGLFFGCVFPIPVIMYCLIRKVVAKCSTESQQQQVLNSEERNFVNDDGMRQEPFENSLNDVEENCNDLISTVQQILCGPFKDKVNSSKFLSWDGVYIFRRLFIVSVFVFVEDATYKLYVLLAGQILILMHHSHVKPYKSKFLNFLESASLGFLVLINGMNLLSVYDFAHGISEVGDKLLLLKIFAWIETVLHLLVPTLIITSLAVLLIVRCFYIIFKILRYLIRAVTRLVIQCCS